MGDPWRACDWRPRLPPKGFLHQAPPAMRGNHVGAHVRSNDTSAAQFLVMRGPHGCHLFASLEWPRQTRCSLEAIDIKYTIGFFAGDTVGIADPLTHPGARCRRRRRFGGRLSPGVEQPQGAAQGTAKDEQEDEEYPSPMRPGGKLALNLRRGHRGRHGCPAFLASPWAAAGQTGQRGSPGQAMVCSCPRVIVTVSACSPIPTRNSPRGTS